MEATALFDFTARSPTEMSFKKGSILKVLTNQENHEGWLRAEQEGQEGLVPANHITMRPHDWYHGPLSRLEAEGLLQGQKHNGAFLVRESESNPGEFSISVKFLQGVQHFKITRESSGKYSVWLVKFPSVNQLVSYHRRPSMGKTQQLLLGEPVQLRKLVVALWDFQKKEEGMLRFHKGDAICLLDKTTHRDWWKGEKDGTSGIFPKSYVKEIS